jgi:hypothetical protein
MTPAEEELQIKRRKEVWEQVQAEKGAIGETICTTNEKRKHRPPQRTCARKRVESRPIDHAAWDGAVGGGSVSNAVSINVQAAPGQSPEAIASAVERRMSEKLNALSRGAFSDGVY